MSTIFKCFKHSFETDDPQDWANHVAGKEHTVRGKGLCNNCNQPVNVLFNGKQAGKVPALCQGCAKAILDGAQSELIKEDELE